MKPTVNQIICGSNIDVVKPWPTNCIDGIVCDPPYGLEFMGKEWDKLNLNVPFSEKETKGLGGYKHHIRFGKDGNAMQQWHYQWAKAMLRITKPGGFLLCFGGDRTHHRLACAIEDAGWEIRTSLYWIFGSGFPKSYNISKKLTNLLPADLRCSCAVHSSHIVVDSQSDCRPVDGLCDAQPLSGQDSVQDVSPLQGGALEHNHVGLDEDALDKALKHILGRSSIDPLSSEDCAYLVKHLEADSRFLGNKLADILLSKLHASSQASHKKVFHNKDKSDLVSGSVSSLPYSCSPTNAITQIYHKCQNCQGFFCKEGFGTALKPAVEIIIVAMKPLDGTFAQNMLKHGVAGLNIDGGRIYRKEDDVPGWHKSGADGSKGYQKENTFKIREMSSEEIQQRCGSQGRWPANLILDEESARLLDEQTGKLKSGGGNKNPTKPSSFKAGAYDRTIPTLGATSGGASRFFYCAKTSRKERNMGLEDCEDKLLARSGGAQGAENRGEKEYLQKSIGLNRVAVVKNNHPTVKPLALMKYLCTLLKMPSAGQIILDPFLGSGTTGIACKELNINFIGIEKEREYCEISIKRIAAVPGQEILLQPETPKVKKIPIGKGYHPDEPLPHVSKHRQSIINAAAAALRKDKK